MPAVLPGSAVGHRRRVRGEVEPVVLCLDRVLDATVVLLATWTLVYHLCFVLRLSSTVALVAEAAALVAVLGVAAVHRDHADPDDPDDPDDPEGPSLGPAADATAPGRLARTHPRLFWTTVSAAGLATVSMALQLPWLLVWVPWLLAAGSGAALALTFLPLADVEAHADAQGAPGPLASTRTQALVVLGVGVAAAALSLVVLRPNPDDLFYVNLSQWVAAHGSFPHRDTIYADLVYPLSNWPPLASYDAGVGALAHVLGVRAATVAYVAVPPVVALLSVLALWRLLRAWQVRHVLIALAAAVAFLMVDGTSSYGSPGNLWVTRLWQGKVILLCVVVPWLLVSALRYVRAPGRDRAIWLVAGGVAAVGCSTTALFLVPVVALAGAAPLLRRDPRRAVAGFAAMAAYPLLMGVVTQVVGGRSADDFGARRQFRFDPSWFGHEVFLDGVVALVGVGAVLLGCLLVPDASARVTTAVAALLTGMTFVPGLTHLSYDLVGLGPTLWRLTWSLSVAALVGATASYAATRLRSRSGALAAGAAATGLLATFGHPVLAADTRTTFAAPPHWQRGPEVRAATGWTLDHTRPGDRVLAPDGLAITVAVTTTAVKTVTPRDYYLAYLRDEPGFDYEQRLLLTHFVNQDPGWAPGEIAPALDALGVVVACVYASDHDGVRLLDRAGYLSGALVGDYRCLIRT